FLTLVLILLFRHGNCLAQSRNGENFAKANGTQFAINGKPLYLNGFNAYWLMYMGSDPSTRDKVTSAFQQASNCGMNVARIWAFNDGGNNKPLQISPGVYDENIFRGLDFAIAEAKKHGIYLIPSLVNNYVDFGGKPKYVQWARERGQQLKDDDDFYTNPVCKEYYKNHVKAVLTRTNSITGVAYKDDPTIFAWELMNEPKSNDTSGKQIQEWVKEMASFVKSIDNAHMLEIGLEGFYGASKKQFNPGSYLLGTDFIDNNLIPEIDFTTIHLYPEQCEEQQSAFVDGWLKVHIQDSSSVLKKPLVIAEFGKSSTFPGYSLEKRDRYFRKIYDSIYNSASRGGPFVGGLFWQVMAQGMEKMDDGYQVVLEKSPSTASLITAQSRKIIALG
ncbi:hypothetical protein Tsubulata_046273, partial [Turnera subulata]